MVNKKFWKNKKVLITGHTGFKGSWLSSILYKLGCELYGYSLLKSSKKELFNAIGIGSKFKASKIADINNYKKLNEFLNQVKPQVIFHLAAQPLVIDSYYDPLKTFNTNIIGTANLIESARYIRDLKSLVIVTTDKCYLNEDKKIKFFKETDQLGGSDPYSASKACAELISKSYQQSFFKSKKANIATVRAGNIIGGGDYSKYRIFTDISNSLINNKKLVIRNPGSIRPWQHVIEPLIGYINLAEKLFKGKKEFIGAWNFGPGSRGVKTVLDVVKEVNKTKKINFTISKKKNLRESKYLALSINKSKNKLKWAPKLSFSKSIKLTVDWYLSRNKRKITEKQITNYLKIK